MFVYISFVMVWSFFLKRRCLLLCYYAVVALVFQVLTFPYKRFLLLLLLFLLFWPFLSSFYRYLSVKTFPPRWQLRDKNLLHICKEKKNLAQGFFLEYNKLTSFHHTEDIFGKDGLCKFYERSFFFELLNKVQYKRKQIIKNRLCRQWLVQY